MNKFINTTHTSNKFHNLIPEHSEGSDCVELKNARACSLGDSSLVLSSIG